MMILTKKRKKASLTQPSLERLLEKVPSKYELVLLASRRARQIKREVDLRPERIRDFEFTKPLTQALFEIVEGKVTAEDLKYVDLLEETDKSTEPGQIATEIARSRFFEDDEPEAEIEIEEFGPEFEDIEAPDAFDFEEE
jgi:DNA-directed RNA polymerase subunit omega